MFDNIDGVSYATNPFNTSLVGRDAYVNVATLMSRMWTSFIHDLDPNNHGLPGYAQWPKYNITNGGVGDNMVFDANDFK